LAYLDQCRAQNAEPTLCGLVGYIDAHNRIVVTLDEISEILRQSPSLLVGRAEGRVRFSPSGTDRRITSEDLDRAFADHAAEVDTLRRRRRAEMK
jgi:hypothetical protein